MFQITKFYTKLIFHTSKKIYNIRLVSTHLNKTALSFRLSFDYYTQDLSIYVMKIIYSIHINNINTIYIYLYRNLCNERL